MNKKISKKILSILLLAVFLLTSALDAFAQGHGGRSPRSGGPGPEPYYTPHYAPDGRMRNDLPNGYLRLIMGGLEYFYWEGMFYRMRTNGYVVVPAPVGAVVTAIPQGSQPVMVDGVAYYNINGVTYMYTPYGYQVVPPPKLVIVKNYLVEQKADTVATTDSKAATPAIANTGASATAAKAVTQEPSGSDASVNSDEAFTVNIPNSKGEYTAVTLKRSGNGFIGPQGEYYPEFPKIEQLKVMYAK